MPSEAHVTYGSYQKVQILVFKIRKLSISKVHIRKLFISKVQNIIVISEGSDSKAYHNRGSKQKVHSKGSNT